MGRVVFSQSLSESAAGGAEFPGAGRGPYVVSVSVSSGGPVGFRLFCRRGLGIRSGWAEVTPGSNPCAALASGDSASFTVSVGPWPSFRLEWDAAFDGTVSVVASR